MATTTASASTKPQVVTADDLLQRGSTGPRGELIRGVFCEMPPPGHEHGEIIMRLGAMLLGAVTQSGLGRVSGADSGVWVERNPDTVRAPDVSFFSVERMPLDAAIPGYAEIVPDLAVEVVSPNDRVTEVNDKARMWIDAGVKLVWVVWPQWHTVEVHQPDAATIELSGDATLDGQDVLPGFSTPISAIFAA